MTTLGGTVTDSSLQVLEELDFEPGCQHSQHAVMLKSHDDGPAKYVVQSLFPCGHTCERVAVCARFAERIIPSPDTLWRCTVCSGVAVGHEVTWDIRPLNEVS